MSMDLNALQNITPIKLEEGKGQDASFTSTTSNCSYFNINEWQGGGEDVADSSKIYFPRPPGNPPQCDDVTSTPAKLADARKSLFDKQVSTINDNSDGSENTIVSSQQGSLNSTMQKSSVNFLDMWKTDVEQNCSNDISHTYAFAEETSEFQNKLNLDLFCALQEFTPDDVTTQVTQQSSSDQSSGYQCQSYPQTNNGMMRTYSNDLNNQQMAPHQTSMQQSMGNIGMQHLGYQATSPNNGDGPNSSHNSPFTASPSQPGFDYPTTPPMKPSIPSNTDYPGEYSFAINFGEATESAPKSAQYTYSHSLNKLFVKMNVTCPIRFKCSSPPPSGCTITAVPVFKRPEHVTDVVTRCPNHKIPDEAHFVHSSSHLIRADMPEDSVRYNVAADMRESVSVRYERPQIGAEFTTVLYKFMCLSSCVGGINRRPLLTVFNLENSDGQVLGRRVVEVRICSCPGRDRAQEEKRKLNDGSAATSNGHDKTMKRTFKNMQTTMEITQTGPGKKRRMGNGSDQEEFVLKVRGRDKYMILKRVKEALDLMELVTPQQQEAYRSREEQEQALFRQQHLATDATSRNIPTQQDTKGSTPLSSNIQSVFTVSNPLTSSEVPTTVEGLMCPTHSSHPLTATPTGVSNTTGDECTPPTSYADPTLNPHHYWSVEGGQLGCDIPDGCDPLHLTPSASNFHPNNNVRNSANVPCCSTAGLSRESSGASTISVSSGGSAAPSTQSRYVTRVLLRQTLSLNRGSDVMLNHEGKNQSEN